MARTYLAPAALDTRGGLMMKDFETRRWRSNFWGFHSRFGRDHCVVWKRTIFRRMHGFLYIPYFPKGVLSKLKNLARSQATALVVWKDTIACKLREIWKIAKMIGWKETFCIPLEFLSFRLFLRFPHHLFDYISFSHEQRNGNHICLVV